MKPLVTLLMALAALSQQPTLAQEEFHDTTIKSEYVTVSLYCSNTTDLPINDTNPVSWMLPNFTVLYESTANQKFLIKDENWTLVIQNATADDFGSYHCLLPVNGYDYFLVKLGLNARGPYFEDLWEKYKLNTVIGVSAAGGFAVLSLLLYLLDHFRYREPEEEEEQKRENGATTSQIAYDNQGFSGYVPAVELGTYGAKNGSVAQSKPDKSWADTPSDDDDITAL